MRRLLSRHSRCLTGQTAPAKRLDPLILSGRSTLLSQVATKYEVVTPISALQTTRFFSTNPAEYPGHFFERTELDSTLPLSNSVQMLLNIPVGRVHPLDFYNKFPSIMRACCKSGNMEQAQRLLERMLREKRESGRVVVPAKAFETLIFGWTKIAKKEPKKAIKSMMDIVNLMEQEHEYDYQHALETAKGDSCQSTTETYNTVLRGMAEAATFLPPAARDAEKLLEKMESIHREKGWHTNPNNRSYTYVITAYGNVRRHDSGDLAEAVLERMKQMHKLEVKEYDATHDNPYNVLSPKDNTHQVITPDAAAYTAVIRAHANSKSRDAANKAYAVLTEMHNNVRPDAIAITTCINAFANVAGKSSGDTRDRVPAHERAEAAERAEALLLLMGDLAKEEGNMSTSESYSVPEGDMGSDEYDEPEDDFGQSFADEGENQSGTSLQPTVIAYNSCLNAWAKSDTQEAAPRAGALLQGMIESSLNDTTAVKPNRTSFNTVINAHARFSRYDPESPEKAEDLLNLMYDLYYSGRLETVKPDAVTYTSVMNAWARSGDRPDKVHNARRLLDVMLSKYDADERDVKPNIMAYTSILNAAVHSPPSSLTVDVDKDEDPFTSDAPSESVYSIVVQTYDELKKDPYNIGISPDHFAFAIMLQAIRQHTSETSGERRQMVELVFDDACAAGEVSAFVIRALREACPSVDLLERLLRSQKLARELRDVGQLPQDWTRNLDYSPRLRKVDRGERQREGRQQRKQRKGKNRKE